MSQTEVRDGMHINFDSMDVIRDPFTVFEQIRARGPVVWNALLGVWMVVGFEELQTALHSPNTFSNAAYRSAEMPDMLGGAQIMINTDPPEQVPLRRVAQQAFLRSSLAKLEGTISGVVEEMLDSPAMNDEFAAGNVVELMATFCRQVPAKVISLLLGVPVADLAKFIKWSDDLSAVVDSGQRTSDEWPKTVATATESGAAMRAYLQEQIDDHRVNERDDLINDLLIANGNGTLNDAELLATLVLLLIAGNETTTKLIAATLRLLDEYPEQRQAIVDDPTRIVDAIEEALRFEGVTTLVPRIATEDVTLGGANISAGEYVLLLLGGANRDPDAFDDPNRFDITRNPNHHMAFGHGVHHCLGNRLARMEAQIAVAGFLKRYPTYTVKDFAFKPVFLARGLARLDVSVPLT